VNRQYLNTCMQGNCLEELKKLADNSVDAEVTDPPYELGFMGKKWDNSGIAYNVEMWRECWRVLKPGGHLLAFGGTRTYHRMATAIEDAGFEIRDMIEWVYGCLSEDTEILTLDGWRQYSENIANSLVMCYDIDSDSYKFIKPTKCFIYENEYTAYRIKSDKTDQIVSKNHRVIVERDGIKSFQYAETLRHIETVPYLKSISNLNTKTTLCTVTPIEYKGRVWCVEVPTGAFVARRNGLIFVTGNSGFPKSLNVGKAVITT
jgi:hypothetical protein